MFSFRLSASTWLFLQILVQIFFVMFTTLQLRLICFRCLAFLSRLLRASRHFLARLNSLSSKMPSLELFLPLPSVEKFAKQGNLNNIW